MAKTLKAVAPQKVIEPSLKDPRFVPHEFKNCLELFKERHGWVPPSERKHLKELLPGEELGAHYILGIDGIVEVKL